MPALWAVAPILLVSAASKLFSPGSSQAAFDSLRVPQVLNRPCLAKAFPVLEILLALAALVEAVVHLRRGAGVTALGLHGYPTAVLLGADGLTAGGPVAGPDEVLQMADEVRDLFGEEPAPAPTPYDAPLTLLDHSTTAEGPSA